jgi:hypothetical protein
VKVFPSVKRRWISTILHNGILPHAIATRDCAVISMKDMKVFHHSDIPRISNINLQSKNSKDSEGWDPKC